MRGRAAVAIALSDEERTELEMRARRRKTARADAQRAAIVLLAAAGKSNTAIAECGGVTSRDRARRARSAMTRLPTW